MEGMAIAGYAIGASEGYIYCRAEYPLALERLLIALEQVEQCGPLGDCILGSQFSFHIKIKEGAGAFVWPQPIWSVTVGLGLCPE